MEPLLWIQNRIRNPDPSILSKIQRNFVKKFNILWFNTWTVNIIKHIFFNSHKNVQVGAGPGTDPIIIASRNRIRISNSVLQIHIFWTGYGFVINIYSTYAPNWKNQFD
jgi:hypothetical protein